MNAAIESLCVSAVKEVFGEMGFPDIGISDSPFDRPFEVMSSIGLTGDISGYLLLRTDFQTAVRFGNAIAAHSGIETGEADPTRFGSFHREAFAEVSNQVSGRTIMLFSQHDYDCNITPPTVIAGNGITVDLVNLLYSYSFSLSGEFGTLSIFMGLKKLKTKKELLTDI